MLSSIILVSVITREAYFGDPRASLSNWQVILVDFHPDFVGIRCPPLMSSPQFFGHYHSWSFRSSVAKQERSVRDLYSTTFQSFEHLPDVGLFLVTK